MKTEQEIRDKWREICPQERKPGCRVDSGTFAIELARWIESAPKLLKLETYLHSRCQHPDYEYETTKGPRKKFDEYPPEGDGWERNIHYGRDGWERFDYHEEAYWMRLKIADNGAND